MRRYERYAAEIAESIRKQTLRPGDRLPSVRKASASRGISPSTVFEAYYLLEAKGLIQARPRSGYYVSARALPAGDGPRASAPGKRSTRVEISDLVFEVLGSVAERDVVPLGSAFPGASLFPLDRLARAMGAGMRRLDPWRIVEGLPRGSAALRRHIALRYALDGTTIHPDELIITSGALDALNLCLQAVTRPGDVVAIESPTFYAALQAIERLQLKAIEVATDPRDGIDLAALATVLAAHPVKACWLMPNFQNPLGSLMPDANKRALVDLLRKHQVPLIEDDVYGELYYGPTRPRPAKAYDRDGLVMHCSSFSKCLAPGYRVGWVAAGRYARQIQRLKLMTTLSAAVPSQEGIAEYLTHGGYDRHLRHLRHALEVQQALTRQAIARHFPAGTRVTQPEGGYFLWVELPPSIDALALHQQALLHDISIAPGQLFSNDRRFKHFIRINYGHADDTRIAAAMRTVGMLACALMR